MRPENETLKIQNLIFGNLDDEKPEETRQTTKGTLKQNREKNRPRSPQTPEALPARVELGQVRSQLFFHFWDRRLDEGSGGHSGVEWDRTPAPCTLAPEARDVISEYSVVHPQCLGFKPPCLNFLGVADEARSLSAPALFNDH